MDTTFFIIQGMFAILLAGGGWVLRLFWGELDAAKKEYRDKDDDMGRLIKHTSDRVSVLNLALVKEYPTKEDFKTLERKIDQLNVRLDRMLGHKEL